MITTAQEYFALYHQVTAGNPPDLAVLLPTEENIYNVDLDSRTIEAPKIIGVTGDQRAKVIYFSMNRYYDNFDLSRAIGVIEYINADNEGFIYGIPFYDLETLNNSDPIYPDEPYDAEVYNKLKASREKILFPWVVGADVTKSAGQIQFSMSFYVLDKDADQIALEGNQAVAEFVLRLNLLPTTSQVLAGIGIQPVVSGLEKQVEIPTLIQLYQSYTTLSDKYAIYWDESADEMTKNPSNSVAEYVSRVTTSKDIADEG